MRTLLVILFILLGGVMLAFVADSSDGYVMLQVGEYLITMSMLFFVCAFGVVLSVLYVLLRTIIRINRLPMDAHRTLRQRRLRLAEKHLSLGLASLMERDWERAEKHLRTAAKNSATPYVSLLLAARAAQQRGAESRSVRYLERATRDNPDASLLVGITQAELQLDHDQNRQALATLSPLQKESVSNVRIGQLMLEACSRLGRWEQVLQLLPELKKRLSRGRGEEQGVLLERQLNAWEGLLRQAGEQHGSEAVNQVWNSMPARLRRHSWLLETYVSQRLRKDDAADCEPLLRKSLRRKPDQGLLRLYGLVRGKHPLRQLSWLERLLRQHQGNWVLLLSLGRLAAHSQLWGKARTYLENSIASHANPEACYELGRLYQQEGNRQEAARYFEQGLALVSEGDGYVGSV